MSESIKKCLAPSYDEQGHLSFETILTNESDTDRAHCFVQTDHVIPVLFVPGIMGSNLRVTGAVPSGWLLGRMAWRPDDGAGSTWAGANSLYNPLASSNFVKEIKNSGPGLRQRLMNPQNTEVDNTLSTAACAEILDSLIDKQLEGFKLDDEQRSSLKENYRAEYARRGWGSVMLSAYGPLMSDLELKLNRIYVRGDFSDTWDAFLADQGARAWGRLSNFQKLTPEHLKHCANFWYPVHAVGYNWLQSNTESGKYLADKIQTTIAYYKKLDYHCEHVVLVTHSMGGLVARAACNPACGNAQGLVLGIVHGEMPATGAPAAYKRLRAGFEGTAKAVLGKDAANVTAVLAHAPGGLELLPSQFYSAGQPWLFIDSDDKKSSILGLPGQSARNNKAIDPYQEIYLQEDAWWRPIQLRYANPDDGAWLPPDRGGRAIAYAPQQVTAAGQKAWKSYKDAISVAQVYHTTNGEYYHPRTYAHYGIDRTGTTDVMSGYSAWSEVRWAVQGVSARSADFAALVNGTTVKDDMTGTVNVQIADQSRRFMLKIAKPTARGDGTVPEQSAWAVDEHAAFVARMTGFEHQDSYKDKAVQDVTRYSIMCLVQNEPVQ